jgi:O-antigen ligase
MYKNNGQAVFVAVMLLFLCFVYLVFSSQMKVGVFSLSLLLSPLVFFIAFTNMDAALTILIFSMLLSPEFKIGSITDREIVLRMDDVFLAVIFVGWMARTALNKKLWFIKNTSLTSPIVAYILVCLLATGVGVLRGTTSSREGVFYILKYLEYFMVFFMVSNTMRDKKQARRFIFFMLVTCFITSAFALYVSQTQNMRATAPFETGGGEANTLAGYLLIMIAVTAGLFIYNSSVRLRVILGSFMLFIAKAFMMTMSRGGWMGLAPLYATFLVFSRKGRFFLLFIAAVIIFGASFIFPDTVVRRFHSTFTPGQTYYVFGKEISLDESGAHRIESWNNSIKLWVSNPILGQGVPGTQMVVSDVQFSRVLRETGIIGFFIFIWLIFRLYKTGITSFKYPGMDNFGKGLSIGFLGALSGLLLMGLTAEVFIIIRIMEPFWFLAAVVTSLPGLPENAEV